MNEARVNRHQTYPSRFRQRDRHRGIFELLEELLGRDRKANPEWARQEDERLTKARFELFGCAPK